MSRKHRDIALRQLQTESVTPPAPDLSGPSDRLRRLEAFGTTKTPEEWVEFYNLSLLLKTGSPADLLLECFRKAMSR